MSVARFGQIVLTLAVVLVAAAFFLRPSEARHREQIESALALPEGDETHDGEFRDLYLATTYTAKRNGALLMQCWGALHFFLCTEPEGRAPTESF